MKSRKPRTPDGFAARAAREIAAIRKGYELDPAGELLLLAAEEALRRWGEARAIVDAQGLVAPGQHGPKIHPAATAEMRARADLIAILSRLHLEGEDG